MRKLWITLIILGLSSMLLSACSDDGDAESTEPTKETESEKDTEEKEDEDSTDSTDHEYGDQLDLGIGDVGTFETSIGIFEVTLNDAELIDASDKDEYDGQEVRMDYLFKVDLTVKNISDETYSVDDFLGTIVVTDDLEGSGYQLYGKHVYDSLEDISGDLEPGEEKTGELMVDIYEGDEYYLMRRAGNTAAGGTNEVIFTIPADDIK